MKITELLTLRQSNYDKYCFYKKRSELVSTIRLIDFLFLLVGFITYFSTNLGFWLILALVLSFFFIVLIYYHDKIENNRKYYMNLMVVIDDYISRINGEWTYRLKETGTEFVSDNKRTLEDLGVIGESSLFGYLNVAVTHGGKKKLFDKLSNSFIDDETLISNQECVLELSKKFAFCLDFQAKIKSVDDNIKLEKLSCAYLNPKVTLLHLIVGILATIMFITFLIYGITGQINKMYTLIPFLIQLGNLFVFHYTNRNLLNAVEKTILSCSTLYDSFSALGNEQFESKKLKQIGTKISASLIGLKKIVNLAGWDTLRKGMLTVIIANFAFPVSILILLLFDKVIKKHSGTLEEGITSFEELESLLSLSIIGQVKENICIPKRVSKISIDFSNIQHPLLTEKTAVPNDFYTPNGVNVITGSNMSGKTSFMKTIGINLVLMNAGTFVNASSCLAAYFKIFTSMRITDDISNGISTFYAELLRIKEAIEYQKENRNMLTLIDEVFKGTNSNDRIQGAISLINRLNTSKSVVMITTHDFELCDIKTTNIFNYNFSEYYEGNEIKFTYKINKGKCKTTNALFLMRLVGIMD